jgi:hypothetical protein
MAREVIGAPPCEESTGGRTKEKEGDLLFKLQEPPTVESDMLSMCIEVERGTAIGTQTSAAWRQLSLDEFKRESDGSHADTSAASAQQSSKKAFPSSYSVMLFDMRDGGRLLFQEGRVSYPRRISVNVPFDSGKLSTLRCVCAHNFSIGMDTYIALQPLDTSGGLESLLPYMHKSSDRKTYNSKGSNAAAKVPASGHKRSRQQTLTETSPSPLRVRASAPSVAAYQADFSHNLGPSSFEPEASTIPDDILRLVAFEEESSWNADYTSSASNMYTSSEMSTPAEVFPSAAARFSGHLSGVSVKRMATPGRALSQPVVDLFTPTIAVASGHRFTGMEVEASKRRSFEAASMAPVRLSFQMSEPVKHVEPNVYASMPERSTSGLARLQPQVSARPALAPTMSPMAFMASQTYGRAIASDVPSNSALYPSPQAVYRSGTPARLPPSVPGKAPLPPGAIRHVPQRFN